MEVPLKCQIHLSWNLIKASPMSVLSSQYPQKVSRYSFQTNAKPAIIKSILKRYTKKSFGSIYINIVDKLAFKPDEGTTIYGVVSTTEGPVKGVVVSDGVEVTITDENGIYQLKSAKKWKYAFISIPSSYEVPSSGVLPIFIKR